MVVGSLSIVRSIHRRVRASDSPLSSASAAMLERLRRPWGDHLGCRTDRAGIGDRGFPSLLFTLYFQFIKGSALFPTRQAQNIVISLLALRCEVVRVCRPPPQPLSASVPYQEEIAPRPVPTGALYDL